MMVPQRSLPDARTTASPIPGACVRLSAVPIIARSRLVLDQLLTLEPTNIARRLQAAIDAGHAFRICCGSMTIASGRSQFLLSDQLVAFT